MSTTLTASLTIEQERAFQAWRADALATMPYFARVLYSLRVLDAPGLGTFAVDGGHRLYVDFDEILGHPDRWTQRVCSEALLHECSHLFGGHKQLADDMSMPPSDQRVWNVAGDCAINDDLRDAGCKSLVEFGALLPEKIGEPDYQTPNHYFAALKKMQQQQEEDRQGEPQPGPGDPSDDSGEGSSPGDPGQDQDGEPQPGDGEGQDGSCEQSGSGNGTQDPQQQDGPNGTGGGGGQDQPRQPFRGCGSGSGGESAPCELPANEDLNGTAPAASPIERENVRIATAAAIREHAAKSRGTVPGGLLDQALDVLAPAKTPWQRILSAAVRRSVASRTGMHDVDRSRRNRRRHKATIATVSGPRRYVVPGHVEPEPRIHVVRDTSGSMSLDDLLVVGREIEAIGRKLGIRGDTLTVSDVDTVVHPPVPYRDPRSIRDVKGRGGTDMRAGIAAALDMKPRPHAVVVLTDGYTPWPTSAGPIPVVAAIVPQRGGQGTDEVSRHVPGWIKTVVCDLDD